MSGMGIAIEIGGARIDLQNVRLREDVLLDELHLEGGDIRIEPPAEDGQVRVTSGETRVRAMMSEANLNRLVAANLPADAPVRGLHIALLSGRARISGKALISIVPFPFSIEAKPRIENGVRVTLDCRTATLGVDLPRAVVDILEQRINDALGLDVGDLDIPLWIDEVRCEPGRLTAIGRARIELPPRPAIGDVPRPAGEPAAPGFVLSSEPLFGDAEPSQRALSAVPRTVPADSASTAP